MSQSRKNKQPDGKKQPENRARGGEEEKRPRSGGRRRVRWSRVIGLVAALTILISVLSLGFNIFGKVDFSSQNYKYSAKTAVTSDSAAVGATTAASSTAATTAASGSSSIASGDHYVQPANADWNLKLVNAWNTLDRNYEQSLVTYLGDNKFDSRAIDKLKALIAAGKAYNIRVASTYRSYDLQSSLFEKEVKSVMSQQRKNREDAEKIAATSVARPGTSEHNLGLATDLLFQNYTDMQASTYENTDAYKWMLQNCADYGFILRFPKNKQDITGVEFEPWHYRYVGEDAAHEIMSQGICLEEYLQEKGK